MKITLNSKGKWSSTVAHHVYITHSLFHNSLPIAVLNESTKEMLVPRVR